MGMDFQVNVNVKTNGKEAVDSLERQIQKLQGETVNVKINLDGLSKNSNVLAKQFQDAGKQASASFAKGMSSAKFNNPIDYAKFKKENQKQINSVAKQMKKAMSDLSDKDANKWATEYVAQHQKAYDADVKAAKIASDKRAKLEQATNERWQKNLKVQEQAVAKERAKVNAQQLADTQKNANAQKKIQVQQQIAGMKANAILKNAKSNAWVDTGKEKILNLLKEQQNQQKYQDSFIKKYEASQSKLSAFQTDSFKNSLNKYNGTDNYERIVKNIEKASILQKGIESEISKGISGSNFDKVNKDLTEMNSLVQKATSSFSSLEKPIGQLTAVKAGNATLTWLEQNNKAAKDYGETLKVLAQKQKEAVTSGEQQVLQRQVDAIKSKAIVEGKTGRSWSSELKRSVSQIAQFAGVYGTIQNVAFQVPGKMAQAVKDVDTAMTNLYKVTDETSDKYNEFIDNAGSKAKSLGRDMSSYITQTSEWAKLGYSMAQSQKLSEISSIYANVGEVSDKTAVSDLVTVMKAYNMGDSQALKIVDMLNELGNSYATDAASLGDGLKNMASTMAMNGTSLEKSLAILTGGTEITQDAGELGNAIKVAVLRLHGQKGKLEDMGEYADDIESVSKMQTHILKLTKGAVNIMESANPKSFRDYYDVMEDISEILPTLNETDQADLIETLFGKNRANQGQAILQAFQSGQIQKALHTAMTSEGSAMEEQSKWLDSIEAKLQQFQAQVQKLSTTALSSDLFKGVIDGGTGFLNIVTQITDKIGLFAPLAGGLLTKTGLGKRNAALYKMKQNYRRFINVENFVTSKYE